MSYGYDPIEERLQDILQLLTTYYTQSSQVTRGDWAVMDKGFDYTAIVYPAPFNNTDLDVAPGGRTFSWTVNVDLCLRSNSSPLTWPNFGAYRDAVIQHLMKYPTLNPSGMSTLSNANLLNISGGEMVEIGDKNSGGGPFVLAQTLQLTISNMIFVALGE